MMNVIASIRVRIGKLFGVFEMFKPNVPVVLALLAFLALQIPGVVKSQAYATSLTCENPKADCTVERTQDTITVTCLEYGPPDVETTKTFKKEGGIWKSQGTILIYLTNTSDTNICNLCGGCLSGSGWQSAD